MTITKSQLLGVNVDAVRTIGQSFADARKGYDKAERQFHDHVANPVQSGHAWHGEGVSDARTVLETNTTALAASRALTEAAWRALDGFAAATSHAQRKLQQTLQQAAASDIIVDEDGTAHATRTLPSEVPHDGGVQPGQVDPGDVREAQRIQGWVKGCLVFATTADQSCSGILGRINKLEPFTTDAASPAALASNRKVLAGALATRNLAVLTRRFWDTAAPKQVPAGESRRDKLVLDAIDVSGCAASVLTSLGEDATGVGAALGLAQGAAAGVGLVNGFKQFAKDAKGKSDPGDGYKPVPPKEGDKLLEDAYRHGRVPRQDLDDPALDDGGQDYTPNSSTPGQPPKYDAGHHRIPYKEFTDIGPRNDSHEVIVVNEHTGETYYSEDNGKSFVDIG